MVDPKDYEMGYLSDPADADHATAPFAVVVAVYDVDGQRSPFTVVYSSSY